MNEAQTSRQAAVRRIHDISPTLRPGMAVWPGDVPFEHEQALYLSRGDSVNLSSIRTSLHTGSHADSPLHYLEDGRPMDRVDISIFIGPCLLVSVDSPGLIRPQHLRAALAQQPERLIVHCNPGYSLDVFPDRYVHFSAEAAEAIGAAGVRLVGLDAPSVDHQNSKDLPAHHAFARHKVLILESLVLDGVPDGWYELIAPPLKIANADGSPVRALLRELEDG
ncbi:MAG TPA: cyclase family protein [Acidobacteriota bacterium]|nr:cyclase family protein [Acidobacteriota bacterium]